MQEKRIVECMPGDPLALE